MSDILTDLSPAALADAIQVSVGSYDLNSGSRLQDAVPERGIRLLCALQ